MATAYVVLRVGGSGETESYSMAGRVENAASAEQARRIVAAEIDEESNGTALSNDGVTLIAVPARNWTSGRGTLKAETQRRIRST